MSDMNPPKLFSQYNKLRLSNPVAFYKSKTQEAMLLSRQHHGLQFYDHGVQQAWTYLVFYNTPEYA